MTDDSMVQSAVSVDTRAHATPGTTRPLALRRRPITGLRHSLITVVVTAVSAMTALTATVAVGVVDAPPASALAFPHSYAGQGVMPFGDALSLGTPTMTLGSVMTAMATTPDGKGYWLVGADGGVFAYGNAPYEGSLGAVRLTGPIVAMASTPDGQGYWLAGIDGGVFAFGDAGYYGSMGAVKLNQPIVGMASTPDGKGYWLVASDGGVFSFGDAAFFGSTGAVPLVAPVVGMVATPSGNGYWLVAADGGIFTFGDATFWGSTGGKPIPDSIVGMAATPNGQGYWLVGWDGSIYTFGNAPPLGSTASTKPLAPVTAITATPDGQGYWLLEPADWSYYFSAASPYSLPVSSSITAIAASQIEGDPDVGEGAFCNPYGPCEAWCALFATWVWRQAGIPIPSYPFTGSIFSWAAAHTRLLPPWALAAPGDAVLYGTGPQTTGTSVHTGIVAQVWPDGAIVTIEGDAGPAVTGALSVIINGPFLPADSNRDNGFPIYAYAQPMA